MRLKKYLAFLVTAFAAVALMAARSSSQCEAPGPHTPVAVKADDPKMDPPEKTYPRGFKRPSDEVLKRVHAEAFKRNGIRIQGLANATPAVFDCRQMGWCIPTQNQANCGSCWVFGPSDQISCAFVKAGAAKADGSFVISQQYTLDCVDQDACNGGWGKTVLDVALKDGIPIAADYGPYTARSGSCKLKAGTKKYKIAAWGFCTPNQEWGISSTQDIKNALVTYGVLSTALAANSDWDNYRSGVMPYRKLSESDVNHEVKIAGWDDSKVVPGTSDKGAWLIWNQWSESWGEKGFCWVGYGSHQVGYEASWVSVSALPPVPPDPNPPVPPGPDPTPGAGYTGTIAKVQTFKDGVPVGPEITLVGGAPSPAGGSLEADLKAAGWDPNTILVIVGDVNQLLADLKAKKGFAVYVMDLMKIMADLAALKADNKIGHLRREEPSWALAA